MKQLFGIILMLFLFTSVSAQYNSINPKVFNYQEIDQQPLHFGFTLGLNTLDFGVKVSAPAYFKDSLTADVTELRTGFHVNIVSEYRLTDYLAVRFLPGLIFGQRNVVFWYNNEKFHKDMKIESNLLDFPVMLKYKAKRINNYRPYIIFGGNVRYDMAAKKDYEDAEEVYIRLNRLDYYAEVGFGLDFYLRYFKFSTEFKYSLGFRNMIADDPHPRFPEYRNSIERLNSSVFLFSMHFE